MSQSLSHENQAYIDGQVAGGAFASRDELADRLKESRRQLDNGEFIEHDDDTLAARIDELKAQAADQSRG